jgi:hypothetical protein
MFDTKKDVEELAADLQDVIRQTRRWGFSATAEAMAEVLRDLEQVADTRRKAVEDRAR